MNREEACVERYGFEKDDTELRMQWKMETAFRKETALEMEQREYDNIWYRRLVRLLKREPLWIPSKDAWKDRATRPWAVESKGQ